MATDFELDRLNAAEDFLLSCHPNSQEFDAALEHLKWVYRNKTDYQQRCVEVIKKVVERRFDESKVVNKLKETIT